MPNTFPSNSVGGGGATTLQSSTLPRLAPELTYPSEKPTSSTFKTISGINAQGALTTALSASGRFIFSLAVFSAMTNEAVTVKLTVDDVVIWDNSFSVTGSNLALICEVGDTAEYGFLVARNLLLEIETLTDTSINLTYRLRPIL